MDNRSEVRDFLASRRARITPDQAGLPTYGDKRRILGLRREEVALLAGVSVDYYVRLERGILNGVSESVLEALARALQLDEPRGRTCLILRALRTPRHVRDAGGSSWAAHNVRLHRTGIKRLRHPVVGDVELTGEALELPADQGLTLITYTAEPGSAAQDALNFLASWTTAHHHASAVEAETDA